MLYFITGNKNKFAEIKSVLPDIEQLDMDLLEIQDLDAHNVVKAKLLEAFAHKDGEFIVEDSSLILECMNGLPGTLIKWFLKTIGNSGLASIAEKFGNNRAESKTVIGYAKNKEEIHFFEASVFGQIVQIRGENSFGWDPIFQPDGHAKTFGEMGAEGRFPLKMRRAAALKLKAFLGIDAPDRM